MATKKEYKINPERKAIKEKAAEIEHVKSEVAKYPTFALIDIQKVPDALLQRLRKTIRDGKGTTFILRKPVIKAVLESNAALAKFVSCANQPVGLLLVNSSPTELNKTLRSSKKKRGAKIGEVAPFDIVVPEGETDLLPGPALSELKTAGLNVQIKGGKIVIAKQSTVAKTGEAINAVKAGALQKLGIQPFESSIGLLFCFDGKYVYAADILDMDLTLTGDMEHAVRDAFNVSINASYPTQQNATLLLQQAYMQSVNASLNGCLYSPDTIGQLLASVLRQGLALESLEKK